jgi:hypothetical protein
MRLHGAGVSRRPLRLRVAAAAVGRVALMRSMFLTYVLLIVAGLVFFTIVGLTHH